MNEFSSIWTDLVLEDSKPRTKTVSNINSINIALIFVSTQIKDSMSTIEINFGSLTSITNRWEDTINVRSLSISIWELLRCNYSPLRLFSLDNYYNIHVPILSIRFWCSSSADHGSSRCPIFQNTWIFSNHNDILIHSGAKAQTLKVKFGSSHYTPLERGCCCPILQSDRCYRQCVA